MALDEDRRELRDKVAALVGLRFGGDYRVAFGHYAADGNGAVSRHELEALLADAGVGPNWTPWVWATAIVAALDADGDGCVSWPEFAAALGPRATGHPAGGSRQPERAFPDTARPTGRVV